MPLYYDQLGREVLIRSYPKRIISVVPSQTELLHYLGLEQEVQGITKFCVHPEDWFHTKTRVGGTKRLNIAAIKTLQPDLILANKEENIKEQIEELAKDFPVWVSDVSDLDTALSMIKAIGVICDREDKATELIENITRLFGQLSFTKTKPLRAAYLIWREPYMSIGEDTFIHQMLQYAGFDNVFKDQKRYPTVTIEDLIAANCDCILLSSEPYPFAQKHIEELQPHLPQTKIMLVDGELFSWYGSRLLKAPAYFNQLHQFVSKAHASQN